jgi:hypothetical protein
MFVEAPFAIGLEPMASQWLTVNKDKPLWVEIELALEPVLAVFQDIGTLLLLRVGGLFLTDIRCRLKKRHSVEIATETPRSAKTPRISFNVMSGFSATRARIAPPCASMRADRRSPPSAFGRACPSSRSRARHRIALAALTPK